jgi:hypothetical protein
MKIEYVGYVSTKLAWRSVEGSFGDIVKPGQVIDMPEHIYNKNYIDHPDFQPYVEEVKEELILNDDAEDKVFGAETPAIVSEEKKNKSKKKFEQGEQK